MTDIDFYKGSGKVVEYATNKGARLSAIDMCATVFPTLKFKKYFNGKTTEVQCSAATPETAKECAKAFRIWYMETRGVGVEACTPNTVCDLPTLHEIPPSGYPQPCHIHTSNYSKNIDPQGNVKCAPKPKGIKDEDCDKDPECACNKYGGPQCLCDEHVAGLHGMTEKFKQFFVRNNFEVFGKLYHGPFDFDAGLPQPKRVKLNAANVNNYLYAWTASDTLYTQANPPSYVVEKSFPPPATLVVTPPNCRLNHSVSWAELWGILKFNHENMKQVRGPVKVVAQKSNSVATLIRTDEQKAEAQKHFDKLAALDAAKVAAPAPKK